MKVNELNWPAAATHVRVETAEGKSSTVEIKGASETLAGVEFVKADYFRKTKKQLVPIVLPGTPVPSENGYLAKLGYTETAEAVAKKAAKAAAKTEAAAPSVPAVAVMETPAPVAPAPAPAATTEETMKKNTKAKGKRPAKAKAGAPVPAPVAAATEPVIIEGKIGHKGPMIDRLLTTTDEKLSTILTKVMKAYPKGDAGRTLKRIRDQADALKKKKVTLTFTDEPEYRAPKAA